MTIRSAAWFDRQLEHVRECLVEACKQHTPQEVAAAYAALATTPQDKQQSLHAVRARPREEPTNA